MKFVMNSIAAFLLVLSLRPLFDAFITRNHASIAADLTGFALGAGLALWFFYLTSWRMVLYDDAIAIETWFSKRRLSRKEILGYRMGSRSYFKGRRTSYYIIVPRDHRTPEIKLTRLLGYDKPFYAWIKTFQYLNR